MNAADVGVRSATEGALRGAFGTDTPAVTLMFLEKRR
jgi:hypothetical protein